MGNLTASRIESHLALLDQGAAIVDALSDDAFRAASPLAPGGTVGKHFRHVLDFYECLLTAVEGSGPQETLDYTRRVRGTEAESDRGAAAARFRELGERLSRLTDRPEDLPLDVIAEEGEDHSTFGRELSFLGSHTVHHYALIGFLVRSLGGTVPETFGVAPSTLRYWQAACARRS